MSYIISVYGEKAFKKMLLPAINNADYNIALYQDIFGLGGDLVLGLEIVDNRWSFRRSEVYTLQLGGTDYFGKEIHSGDILQLETVLGQKLTILIHESQTPFEVYKKYSLKNLRKVTIGNDIHNHISYDYFGLVSKNHAVLEMTEEGCSIYDFSANGVFVNNIRVERKQLLHFGDLIHILGLQIIYLGSILAVEQEAGQVSIDSLVLQELTGEQLNYFSVKYSRAKKKKEYFHRTPRNIEKLERDPIEIEEPPAPVKARNQSMLTSVGPAFTMAVPMLLGSALSIYGSSNSSLLMYSGLVTSVASAMIGSIWGVVNVRTAKKEAAAEERQRKDAYVEYLEKTKSTISEKYERNSRILHARYPEVNKCADFGRHEAALWNRNPHHEDFLYHRLGLGRIPFQVPISIPKERFRVIKDQLAAQPKDILVAYETLTDVPVGIDFIEHALIGVIGGKNKAGALKLVRNLLVQIAANNCYTDVKLVLAYNKENGYEADCLREARFLPHVWSKDGKTRYVADTPSTVDDVFYEIVRILRVREEEQASGKKELLRPWYILIVTDPAFLEGEALAKYVYNGNSQLGLSTVLLVENYEDLPNTCEFILQNDREFQGGYRVTDDISDRIPIRFDELMPERFGQFARRLSDIEVRETEKGGAIPASLTFFEMLGIHSLKELDILTSWRKNRTYESMRAMIGQKAGGVSCYLDIHEKYHGPHGLIAGTTGSGKSETLQTYILSLAMTYSPDDVGFFMIDYKGGGMANLFSKLPHTIGQISNLSGNQVHRAMVSIKSENRRRQRIFNEHGVNNINNYTRLYKNNEATVPIPHLFIIIDEFAELKREEPDFMRELISVAQVGRSLGVHLILATQKPSGTVDDNIWSNTKFRLCLRVQDKQDSNDMLHKPDAAYITQAGRGYLQVGNDEIYELFQSGFSGAVYDELAGSGKNEIVSMYSITGKAALVGNRMKMLQKEQQKLSWISSILSIIKQELGKIGCTPDDILENVEMESSFMERVFAIMKQRELDYPSNEYNRRRLSDLLWLYRRIGDAGTPKETGKRIIREALIQGRKLPETREKTQLDAVVEYLAWTARENGYDHPFTLWMPVLPERIYLSELKGYQQQSFGGNRWPVQEGAWKLEAYIGLLDDPVNQAQMPLMINLSEGGHHGIFGTVVTGKSTFLQSLVYSMVHRYTPDYVNFYLLDFSSHMLGAFVGLAHVGGVIYENDQERLSRFFHMINEMMEERKHILQGGNYAQYVQVNGICLPAIVVVIDQFSNFQEKTEGIYEDTLIQLARNGTGYGIYLVMTSAGYGMTEIPNRIGDNVRTVLTLEMSDKYQYADVLHTMRIGVYPESGVKGRGLAIREGKVLEFQTALSVEAEDDYTRTEKIKEECRLMNESWHGKRARRVPEIPEHPNLSEFMALDETEKQLLEKQFLPLGYHQETASVYSVDLSQIFCWIVQGKPRTGKTNVLRILMAGAAKKDSDIAVIDFTGALKNPSRQLRTRYLQTIHEVAEYWRELLPVIQDRDRMKKEAMAQGLEEEEIYRKISKEKAYYVFIDDLTEFVKCVYGPVEPEDDMQGFLENITEKGRMLGIYIFAGLNTETAAEAAGYTVFEQIVRQKRGIHLGGNVMDQQYLDFSYIPFMEQSQVYKPGIGQLPAIEGEVPVKTVVLPLDKRKRGQEE